MDFYITSYHNRLCSWASRIPGGMAPYLDLLEPGSQLILHLGFFIELHLWPVAINDQYMCVCIYISIYICVYKISIYIYIYLCIHIYA